jgi:hypothetical protein
MISASRLSALLCLLSLATAADKEGGGYLEGIGYREQAL